MHRGEFFSEGHRESLKVNRHKMQYRTFPEGQGILFLPVCCYCGSDAHLHPGEIFQHWSNLMELLLLWAGSCTMRVPKSSSDNIQQGFCGLTVCEVVSAISYWPNHRVLPEVKKLSN